VELPQDNYELFRRAVVERDADAWAAISECYRPLMIAWVGRSQAAEAARERYEDIADEALARAWSALSPDRFAGFPSVAALLAYFRTCVNAAVIDAARARQVFDRASMLVDQSDDPSPDDIVLDRLDRDELWRLITSQPMTEAERIALIERFALDLPPRVIQARHPELFTNVTLVYAAIRNLCDRLRRNQELRQLYA
jgi:DNA-directed RNA polymerase specialized sigma24 family protein